MPSAQRWIIAYDIRDPRRLSRVHRAVRKVALQLQYSVYLLHGNSVVLAELLAKLRTLIDPAADDIRAYPLGINTRMWGLGKQWQGDDDNPLVDPVVWSMMVREPADEDHRA